METSTGKPTPVILGKRYQLQERLGIGGMGSVFRAHDRLTGNEVALKRVTVPAEQSLLDTPGEGDSFDLALAQEFRALATLRHPHIISVYDFGFSQKGQPYYTMEYLEGGQAILSAAQKLPYEEKADLILQMLQALVYLHRRGILHRDLKPGNALVRDGRLKLMDFGISVITERTVQHLTQTTSGTVAYLAPEIFQGAGYSRASDLYAVGVIAFQLLTGQFPYNESNLATMLFEIVGKTVDAAAFGVESQLAVVLNRLLAKSPEERYGNAAEVIADLSGAVGLPGPAETVELWESFLGAARFVGRQEELSLLTRHLEEAMEGAGRAVLVGGESGVGKSRLLEELRVRALVRGVMVMQGHAVSSGRSPYQLWLEVLRCLALFGDLTDEEAAVLKPLVPDLERLLGRVVAEFPVANPQEARQRLTATVNRLLEALEQPVMILLEDLQWAGNESLQLLGELASGLGSQPVLIVGAYRDDEPLPEQSHLALAERVSLPRLTEAATAELSASMLGRSGSDPQLVSLLQRETEGNALFLVEAVRALAEQAGQLDQVGKMALPQSIVSGGIRAILKRRLERVPERDRPLMKLASVAGRELDLALLRALEPQADHESWLGGVAGAAVIEAQGEGWRFAHEKLREEIKASLSHDEHRLLHRRVAVRLETIYPEAPEQAAVLAHHWSVAGDPEKELHYAEVAGRQAAIHGASEDAISFLERALELLRAQPESPERDERELGMLLDLGPQLTLVRGFGAPTVERTYLRAQQLAEQTGRTGVLFQVIWGQWVYYAQVLVNGKVGGLLNQLLRLAEQSGDESLLLAALHAGWSTESARGNLSLAEEYVERGLAIYKPELHHRDHVRLYGHDPGICALSFRSLGLWLRGYPDEARSTVLERRALSAKLDPRDSDGHGGTIANLRGEYAEALETSRVYLRNTRERGSKLGEANALQIQGAALTGLGQFARALATTREALELALLVRAHVYRPQYQAAFLEACLAAGAVDEGLQNVQDELSKYQLTGERRFESEIRRLHGELILAKDGNATEKAETEFQLAIDITRRQGAKSLELRAVMSLARLWMGQGKGEQALAMLADCYGWFTEGFDTADLHAAKSLLDELR